MPTTDQSHPHDPGATPADPPASGPVATPPTTPLPRPTRRLPLHQLRQRRLLVPVALAVAALAAGASLGSGGTAPGRAGAPEAGTANSRAVRHTLDPDQSVRVSRTGPGLPPAAGRLHRHTGPVQVDRHGPPAGSHEEDEADNEANTDATSTAPLLYHAGGAIQTAPKIYLVLWGSSWTTTAGDPNGVANRLHYFYSGLGGSAINNVLKQYSDSAGRQFTNATGQYKGWVRYTGALPAHPTIAQLAAVAKWAAGYLGDTTYNAQYVIALPNGYVDSYTQTASACAWHNWTSAGTGWVTYTALPYNPTMGNCGKNWVNAGSAGTLDGVTINAWHEYAETVNDPGLNVWYDKDGSENADKCSWLNLANKTLTNGYSFPVQPAWSNTWRTQYGYGCYYS